MAWRLWQGAARHHASSRLAPVEVPLLDTLIQLIQRDQRAGVVPADVDAEIAARFVVSIVDRIGRDGTREDPAFPVQDLQE
jgi:hypothetical protein